MRALYILLEYEPDEQVDIIYQNYVHSARIQLMQNKNYHHALFLRIRNRDLKNPDRLGISTFCAYVSFNR